MRKVISLLLCVAMLCSLVIFTVSADYDFAADLADVTIAAGGSGIVEINLTDNPGIASFGIKITGTNGLAVTDKTGTDPGVSFAFTNGTDSALGLTPNPAGQAFWVGPENYAETYIGDMIINIPAGTKAGDYTFTVLLQDIADETGTDANYDPNASFTVTVIEPEITAVNVMLDSGVNIGVYTNAAVPLVAVNTNKPDENDDSFKGAYAIFEDYETTEDGYVCFIRVNPWSMDEDYIIDFATNFTFVDDVLDMKKITEAQEANAIGILSYAKQVMGSDDALDQLLADLLEFGRQAQIYKGYTPSYALPEGLTATALLGGDAFGDDCSSSYGAQNIEEKNASAATKFAFSKAEIEFGSRFVVTLTVDKLSSTALSKARVKVGDVWNSVNSDGTFVYAFSPAEYEGVAFDLWINGTTLGKATNGVYANNASTNTYGPVNYAAYLYEQGAEGADALLDILEAYCNYCVSVAAYIG